MVRSVPRSDAQCDAEWALRTMLRNILRGAAAMTTDTNCARHHDPQDDRIEPEQKQPGHRAMGPSAVRRAAGFAALSLLVVLAAGCGSSSSDPGCPSASSSSGSNGEVDGGGDGATGLKVPLGFKPSNLSFDGIDVAAIGDFVVDRANCTISSEEKAVACGDVSKLAFAIITQPGAGKIGVYVARNIRVEPNTNFMVKGVFAIAIVALENFEILRGIDASAHSYFSSPGGFTYQGKEQSAGGGPGGGGAGSATSGGGGGSFCGIGGNSAALAGGTPALGGPAYGTPQLIPLVGGSAGGSAGLPNAGSGGGAVQLVAGKTFTLAAGGYVTAGGGGGTYAGAGGAQHAAGGGSGGAILVEAPKTTILGTLAANGGAGGSNKEGSDGTPNAVAATSNTLQHGSAGGLGSAAEGKDGTSATWVDGDNAPGGGGGAGRIRVNNDEEKKSIPLTGVLSPSANLPCATGGPLTK